MSELEQVLGLVSQYTFPVVMCLLYYFDMRGLIKDLSRKLDAHLMNHP